MLGIAIHPQASSPDRRRWLALFAVCLGYLMMVLDITIVNVALPSIQRDLNFSQAGLTWVIDAYLIAYGSFLLLAGRLGDLLGRKRVFLRGVALFTIASALCGLSPDGTLLIAARFLQGLGAAVSGSAVVAIIATTFPEPIERAKAMSVYTLVVSGGASIGLLAGGVLTQAISWHWIFFVNVPVGIVTVLLGRAVIDESEGLGLGRGVDVAGSILVTGAMMLGVYAMVKVPEYGWGSAHTLGFAAASAALLAAFLVLEGRIENPIMPLRILRLRGLIGSSVVRGLLVTGGFASFFLGSLYLERVLGYSAVQTGVAFLAQTLMIATLSLGITVRLVRRFGPKRTLIPGLVAIIVGLLILSQSGEHASYFPGIFIAFIAIGIGFGVSFMPLLTMAMADVPERDTGLASGIVTASLQVSAAVGLAALSTVAADHAKALAAQGRGAASALTGGIQLAFIVGAAAVAVGVIVAVVVLRSPQPAAAPDAAERDLPAEAEAQAA